MQYAEKIVALLVKRLGGRVEFSPDDLDHIGEDGEQLLSYKAGLERLEVLEVRRLEVLKVQQPPETASATVVPSGYFAELLAADEPDEPNERVRAAAKRLPEIVERRP